MTKTFLETGLTASLASVLDSIGWNNATGIQSEAIPLLLQGKDVIAQAETGSGKTGAFMLPIIDEMIQLDDYLHRNHVFSALVISPTRELAHQIVSEAQRMITAAGEKIRVLGVIGGESEHLQKRAFIDTSRRPQIVVATPGRLLDILSGDDWKDVRDSYLKNLKHVVLDEADKLFESDFVGTIGQILDVARDAKIGAGIETGQDWQTALFSATMSTGVTQISTVAKMKKGTVRVSVTATHTTEALIQQWMLVPIDLKDLYLIQFLRKQDTAKKVIIFVNTKLQSNRLSFLINNYWGFEEDNTIDLPDLNDTEAPRGKWRAVPLNGSMNQATRTTRFRRFIDGTANVLVATDVASRGLDTIVDIVVNYELPASSKVYVHRIGRTARAGRHGMAMSLVSQYDGHQFIQIENGLANKEQLHQVDRTPADAMDAAMVEHLKVAKNDTMTQLRDLGLDKVQDKKKGKIVKNKGKRGPKRM
ncbi:DEAD/DEAH box helicase [Carpediemonas membranifera]|uniref:DEAD/DEAH box helicase n=1 Tax=Carpediemonas membranifera TaxID=201153 RepID=A0A8J6E439_9EUKA|nr:DEAD/DEAH box helicase [Carpediemonas membranifera]|eukprot:KAG9393982.1 DEAD/DEAH box helicase [Carpediemonas membranifera]